MDDWLMNINKEVFMEPYLAETVVLYQELCSDPMYYECYFKARQPEFYDGVY